MKPLTETIKYAFKACGFKPDINNFNIFNNKRPRRQRDKKIGARSKKTGEMIEKIDKDEKTKKIQKEVVKKKIGKEEKS